MYFKIKNIVIINYYFHTQNRGAEWLSQDKIRTSSNFPENLFQIYIKDMYKRGGHLNEEQGIM